MVDDHHEARSHQCGRQGHIERQAQPQYLVSESGECDPRSANDFGFEWGVGIGPPVVVALHHEARAVTGQNAVKDRPPQVGIVKRDNLPDRIGRVVPDDDQIAVVEPRLHAVAGDDDVPGPAAELLRREQGPHGARQNQRRR